MQKRMKRKGIALAMVSLAPCAALAQSNVTIYGIVDAYVGSDKADGGARRTLVNSGGLLASRLGFKGAEDLGNGLKALYVLEYRLNVDDNTGVGAAGGVAGPARQQYAGLASSTYGTIIAGRLQSAGYNWSLKYDAQGGSLFSPLQNLNGYSTATGSGFNIGGTNGHARLNNAVAYNSPNFKGFTVEANYAYTAPGSPTVATPEDSDRAKLLAVNYANGPLQAGVVYDYSDSETKNTGRNRTDWALGASYNFGPLVLKGTWQSSKNRDGVGQASNQDKVWGLSAVVPVTAADRVLLGYARLKKDSTSADDNANSYAVGFAHNLSKRTTLYAAYSRVKNSGVGTTNLLTFQPVSAGGSASVMMAGMTHVF